MSLLDRYQAWQPERSWDRYQAWRLESGRRYVVTDTTLRALIVFTFLSLTGSPWGRALLVTGIFLAVTIPVSIMRYRRAKTKNQVASTGVGATQI